MKETQFKSVIKNIFSTFGLICTDLPEVQGILTPDFEVTGNRDKYTVELKIKSNDPLEQARETELLSKGELVSKSISIGPRNTLDGIVKSGVKQMAEYDSRGETYRIIWLHSTGNDHELLSIRFKSTLLGEEKLISMDLPNVITCYFFNESSFFSCRDNLDGAIVSSGTELQLWINPFSPRVDKFKNSELITKMTSGVCDPQKMADHSEDIMIADCDIDRKNVEGLLQYLQKKYTVRHLQVVKMEQHTGAIALSRNDQGGTPG